MPAIKPGPWPRVTACSQEPGQAMLCQKNLGRLCVQGWGDSVAAKSKGSGAACGEAPGGLSSLLRCRGALRRTPRCLPELPGSETGSQSFLTGIPCLAGPVPVPVSPAASGGWSQLPKAEWGRAAPNEGAVGAAGAAGLAEMGTLWVLQALGSGHWSFCPRGGWGLCPGSCLPPGYQAP